MEYQDFYYTWVMQREKGCKLIVRKVYKEKVKFSYNRIPLTDEQVEKIAKFVGVDNVPSLDGMMFTQEKEPQLYQPLLKTFFEYVKTEQRGGENFEDVWGKRVLSTVPGTSKLCREKSRDEIWIAKRTPDKQGRNWSYLSAVMITDDVREDFFRACRKAHGNVKWGKYNRYQLVPGDEDYERFNTFIKEEYIRQSIVAKEDKN